MNISKYNITSRLVDSESYYIVNVLHGNADILDKETFDKLNSGNFSNDFMEKGYVCDAEAEKKLFRKKYLDFIDSREQDEVQLFFVTNYSCNFNCSYCYQSGYEAAKNALSSQIIDAFYNYIDVNFIYRKKYITIFGGEPLLNSPASKKNIKYIIEQANLRNLEIAIVTNGYNIQSYIDILKKGNIREVQVTLDGTREVHNKRRHLKNGNSTFDEIVSGVDALLENGIPVNLRVVTDKENIQNLPSLADFAIEKGWTTSGLFTTQLGRNYELHECQTNQGKLYSRLELYTDLYYLIKKFPQILNFHRPAFSISRFLFENGELPAPLFDACTGTKTEWAFDFNGNIYSCTATVGKSDEKLGTFYPEVQLDTRAIQLWNDRDILSIPECTTCSVSLICGGGCASMAKNYSGSIYGTDCRPVKELLELGLSSYFSDDK